MDVATIRRCLTATELTPGRFACESGGKLWDGRITVAAATEEAALDKLASAVADAKAKGIPAWRLPDEI